MNSQYPIFSARKPFKTLLYEDCFTIEYNEAKHLTDCYNYEDIEEISVQKGGVWYGFSAFTLALEEFFNLPLGSIIFGNTALIVRTKDGKEEKYHFRLKYYHEVKEIAERVEDRFPSATQPQQ